MHSPKFQQTFFNMEEEMKGDVHRLSLKRYVLRHQRPFRDGVHECYNGKALKPHYLNA